MRTTERPAAPARSSAPLTLRLNGRETTFVVESAVTLLDLLRERAGLTGTKKGCDRGQCGACTVLVNGRRTLSCLALALAARGRRDHDRRGARRTATELHPVQAAFVEHDAFQCGFCTSGQIMSAVAVIAEGRARTEAEIAEAMSGNLCRCGAYPNIVAAVAAVQAAS